jgi:hypothetical protein
MLAALNPWLIIADVIPVHEKPWSTPEHEPETLVLVRNAKIAATAHTAFPAPHSRLTDFAISFSGSATNPYICGLQFPCLSTPRFQEVIGRLA